VSLGTGVSVGEGCGPQPPAAKRTTSSKSHSHLMV
jgi:hypothetical protein